MGVGVFTFTIEADVDVFELIDRVIQEHANEVSFAVAEWPKKYGLGVLLLM